MVGYLDHRTHQLGANWPLLWLRKRDLYALLQCYNKFYALSFKYEEFDHHSRVSR